MRLPRTDPWLWWILALALAVRLAAGVWWQTHLAPGETFHFPDSESYWELARTVAAGEPYQFGSPERAVFRTPGYPILLAPVFLVAGDEPSAMWGRAVSAVCGTVAVAGVYFWTRHALDGAAARIAAVLAAVYPGAVAMSGLVLSEAAFTAAMAWQLAVWHRHGVAGACAPRSPQSAALRARLSARPQAPTPRKLRKKDLPTPFYAAMVGILGGIATLIRPSWLLFTPLVAALAVAFGRDKKRLASFGLVATAALAATMLPWWVRNWHVTGRFVPTTLQVGASLYDGLSPHADGSSDLTHAEEFAARYRAATLKDNGLEANPTFEYELDRALRQAATAWTVHHPGEAVRLAGIKLLRMWNVWPNEPSFRTWPARLIVAGSFVPVVALATLGIGRLRTRPWIVGLCLAPAGYLTALHVVFVSSIRYRQPAMLGLIVLAAGAAGTFIHRRGGVRR